MHHGMDDTDVIPVRDHNAFTNKRHDGMAGGGGAVDHQVSQKTSQQRRMVSKWQREELEDKYLRQYEENMLLKKHARKQEDKIKRMATKLLRLISDKKKNEAQEKGVGKTRDVETEEMLEELHGKMREYEKANANLREKLMVAKQQLSTQGSRKTAYGHVQSRINTGVHKAPPSHDPRLTKSMRVAGPPQQQQSSRTVATPGLPRYGHSLLEEAREENKHLEGIIEQQNEQINLYEQDIELLKEQMQVREAEFEEDLLKIKQQMSMGQRTAIQENIDVIRLQREVKEKSSKLIQIQGQYHNLEEKLRAVKGSHDQVLSEMEGLNEQLKHEQNRVLTLQNELKSGTQQHRTILELQERSVDLEKECEILKEANERLVTSAFDLEREREWRQRENALKVQIAQLEATLKADVGEKGNVLDRLTEERDQHDKLAEEHKDMRIKYFEMQQDRDALRDKMKFFTKESAVDFEEIEEALMIVKSRKEKQNQDLDFLQRVDEEKSKDSDRLIRELQAEHADTINELEKTRNMLIVQHKINKDYAQEAAAVTAKMDDLKTDYDEKLEEYAQLLDIRAARIRKLESQLRDVAYGTRQYRLQPGEEDMEADDDVESDMEILDETVTLERGQNLFEIHVKRVLLNPEALKVMNDEEPSIFCTWDFYEFEVQATPVMKGPHPEYKFTSQYVVKVDDFFLHYLQKDSCTLELHQSFGTDYRTMAACQLKMRDILDRSHARLTNTVQLIATEGGMSLGSVEYWVRLKVPMEQALRLYKERSKALGYIDSNIRTTEQNLTALDETAASRPPDNVNQLTVKVGRASNVEARRDGIQPSPYCVYKFFDFGDHDTSIVTGSNNPQFNDVKTYPVNMTADLDRFLKGQPLQVFVFDDTDPEEASYLGLAKIPLIPLAHDKPIKGTFELFRGDGTVNGTLDVSIKWKFAYVPPRASTRTAAQRLASGVEDTGDPLHLLPGEQEALSISQQPQPPRTPKSKPPIPRGGPSASSTPQPVRRQPQPEREEHQQFQPIGELSAIDREGDNEGSVVSEGTPVPGESDAVSSEDDDYEEERPHHIQQREQSIPPPEQEQHTEDSMDVTLTESADNHNSTQASSSPVPTPRQRTSLLGHTWPSPKTPAPPPGKKLNKYGRIYAGMNQYEDRTAEELIAEELGESVAEDTMFEAPQDNQDQLDEEESEEEEDVLSQRTETGAETEDSEVIMGSPKSRPHSQLGGGTGHTGDQVTITVGHVSFHADAPVHDDDEVKKLFVEYRFLDISPQETETPYSLPKPQPDQSINFNFTKVFHVDYESQYERRQFLASRLLEDAEDGGRIRFTVVSEPEDDEADCDDVGVAYVSLPTILEENQDVEDKDVPIYDVEDGSTEIGTLNVTVKCLDALLAVQAEMDAGTGDEDEEEETEEEEE